VCDPGDEFSCPGTMDCQEAEVDGESVWVCLPSGGECGGETCPDGWICVDDECVDPCEGVSCESWEECRQGVCVDVSCSSLEHDCPAGEFCINHECVADPCLEADCAEDEFCLRDCDETACSYQCEPLCACAVGEVCTAEGTCVEDDCAEVECEPGERCNGQTGTCEEDPCYWVTCPGAEVCFDGECIADPCDQASCPPHHDCVVVEGSDGRAEPQCQADSSHWVDGVAGQELLATGAGGCHCRGAPEGSKPPGPILLLLLLGGLFAARRRDGGKGGAR
jgi:MYXO-CTERM domain-containing protein